MNLLRLPGFAALALLAGCTSSHSMPVGADRFDPRAADHPIDVYLPVDAPVALHEAAGPSRLPADLPSDAQTIGRIDASAGALKGWAPLLRDARRRARRMGGDALVLDHWNHEGMSILMCVPMGGGKGASFTVARYAD